MRGIGIRTVGVKQPGRVRVVDQSLDQEEVARVAYELWERRGRAHGGDVSDWLEAERIVRVRQAQIAQRN